jgi:hypothetical protein
MPGDSNLGGKLYISKARHRRVGDTYFVTLRDIVVRRKVKLLEIDALDDRTELTSILLEILYHDGVDLNAWLKDSAAICYLFGALDRVRDALIPTWGVEKDLL